jgi:hypothetical protein
MSDRMGYNRLPLLKGGNIMKITGLWMGIIAVILGILIIVWPDLIRWFIGIGLIVLGIMAIIPALQKK